MGNRSNPPSQVNSASPDHDSPSGNYRTGLVRALPHTADADVMIRQSLSSGSLPDRTTQIARGMLLPELYEAAMANGLFHVKKISLLQQIASFGLSDSPLNLSEADTARIREKADNFKNNVDQVQFLENNRLRSAMTAALICDEQGRIDIPDNGDLIKLHQRWSKPQTPEDREAVTAFSRLGIQVIEAMQMAEPDEIENMKKQIEILALEDDQLTPDEAKLKSSFRQFPHLKIARCVTEIMECNAGIAFIAELGLINPKEKERMLSNPDFRNKASELDYFEHQLSDFYGCLSLCKESGYFSAEEIGKMQHEFWSAGNIFGKDAALQRMIGALELREMADMSHWNKEEMLPASSLLPSS